MKLAILKESKYLWLVVRSLGLESFRFQLEHDKCTNLIKHHKDEEMEMDEERPMGLDSSSIVECSNSQCARAKDQQDN